MGTVLVSLGARTEARDQLGVFHPALKRQPQPEGREQNGGYEGGLHPPKAQADHQISEVHRMADPGKQATLRDQLSGATEVPGVPFEQGVVSQMDRGPGEHEEADRDGGGDGGGGGVEARPDRVSNEGEAGEDFEKPPPGDAREQVRHVPFIKSRRPHCV